MNFFYYYKSKKYPTNDIKKLFLWGTKQTNPDFTLVLENNEALFTDSFFSRKTNREASILTVNYFFLVQKLKKDNFQILIESENV
jgi:hypothetical protein